MMKKVLVALWLAVATVSSAFAAMGDEEFVDLCSKDKAAPQILAALAEGANPNARDGSSTALGEACFYAFRDGMKEVVTALLDKGADVNAVCDSEGETPLIRAAGDCGIEIVRRMVELGANVNAPASPRWRRRRRPRSRSFYSTKAQKCITTRRLPRSCSPATRPTVPKWLS
ncbi:MAG: ankyrin repeat domain-containing protein [Pyramidobacter sp.]|nr:ankyrin repeat domain-containing protein [Pyramidobacter sp.]